MASPNNTNLAYTEEEKKKLDAQATQNGQSNTTTQQTTSTPSTSGTTQTTTTTQTTSFAPEVVNSDYSDYLKELYKQQEDAAIADIDAAYNKNVAEIDRAAESIPKEYETARNQAAGSSAQAQRNFDIQAAMVGLGSGTGAQAKIARNVALQNNLNAINTAEANAKADLDLKRTQLVADYNNAIAQAKANGNAALAEALYNEMIRAEQQLIAQQQFNASLGFQEKQHADSLSQLGIENAYRDAVRQDSLDQFQKQYEMQMKQYAAALKQQELDNIYREAIRQDSLDQFMKEYDLAFEQWQKQKEQQQLDNTYRENARKDALDQFNKEYQLAFDKWKAQLSQQDKDNIYRDTAYKDAMAQQAWENAFNAWQLGYTGNYTYDGNGYKPSVESDSDTELLKEMFNALLLSGRYTPNVQTNTGTTIVNPNQQGNQGTQGQGIDITTIPKPDTTPTLTDPNKLGESINNAIQNTVNNNGGVYQVGSDGKAPKGLSVGDQVVTAGGTYEITAVNADGSYQSKLVDKSQTSDNYGGSYDKAPAPTTPTSNFDYELWGSPDEYFSMVGGNTAMANNISNAIRGSGATKEQQDEMLMEYVMSDAISDEEFQYILYQLGRL